MGNQICGTEQIHSKPSMNAISSKYHPSNAINFKEVYIGYLKYPQKYAYILSYLRSNHQQFIDEFFDGARYPEIVFGFDVLPSIKVIPSWQRITKIVKKETVELTDTFIQAKSHIGPVGNVYRILQWLVSQPKLRQSIFVFQHASLQGLVVINLPLKGSHDDPAQVIIDNFIMMNNKLQDYVFNIPSTSTVAMVLLQKALAKILRSYQRLHQKSMSNIFEMVTGIPVCLQNMNSSNEFKILSKYYKPEYFVKSVQINLKNCRSQYIKFSLDSDAFIGLSSWQIDEEQQIQQLREISQVVMELILIKPNAITRVGYASKLFYNTKTVIRASNPEQQRFLHNDSSFFLKLGKGTYLIHLFARSSKHQVTTNIIAYSSLEINLTYRKQSFDLHEIKMKMVENTFVQRYQQLQKFKQGYRVLSLFLKDGYRCILCIKNEQKKTVKVTVSIRPNYRHQIKFQQYEESQIEIEILANAKKLISFIKIIEEEVGNFYSIGVSFN